MRKCTHVPSTGEVEAPHDDSFVVVEQRLEDDWQASVSESLGRDSRLRSRAAAEARGDVRTESACERCLLAMLAELDKQVRSARQEAELYARSERSHALDVEAFERRRARQSEAYDDEIEAERRHCRALREAIQLARAEADAARRERAALVKRNADLDAREDRLWRDANDLEWELEVFRDACAELVTAADRRRRGDDKFQFLASGLLQLDPDRASFDAIDAYIRTASRELATAFDEPYSVSKLDFSYTQ